MYALSLQITYAFALFMALAFVMYYLPYLLVGFLVVLAILAVVALVGWFVFKRKYGALLKASMNPEGFMQQQARANPDFGTPFKTQNSEQEAHAEGPVIQVKAEEV